MLVSGDRLRPQSSAPPTVSVWPPARSNLDPIALIRLEAQAALTIVRTKKVAGPAVSRRLDLQAVLAVDIAAA